MTNRSLMMVVLLGILAVSAWADDTTIVPGVPTNVIRGLINPQYIVVPCPTIPFNYMVGPTVVSWVNDQPPLTPAEALELRRQVADLREEVARLRAELAHSIPLPPGLVLVPSPDRRNSATQTSVADGLGSRATSLPSHPGDNSFATEGN